MAKRKPKALVIDADIAFAAGKTATSLRSIHCHEFLEAVRKRNFCVVMSSDIWQEWKKHMSNFSRKWLTQMTGRKRAVDVGTVKNTALRSKVRRTSPHPNPQKAMEKDCRLLEAALATDKIVFSLDENVRRLFYDAAVMVNEIRPIHWANPELPQDDVIAWLSAGVPSEKKRQLGSTE